MELLILYKMNLNSVESLNSHRDHSGKHEFPLDWSSYGNRTNSFICFYESGDKPLVAYIPCFGHPFQTSYISTIDASISLSPDMMSCFFESKSCLKVLPTITSRLMDNFKWTRICSFFIYLSILMST